MPTTFMCCFVLLLTLLNLEIRVPNIREPSDVPAMNLPQIASKLWNKETVALSLSGFTDPILEGTRRYIPPSTWWAIFDSTDMRN